MKKRLTYNNGLEKSVGLVVLLMMVLCPTTAWAKVGETFSDGVLIYKVTSEVDKEVTVFVYDGVEPTGAVVIPATINGYSVTSIDDSAISDCTGMTSIDIPSSVKSIGGNAFNGCSGLTSVTIPDGVVSIGRRAFKECSGLEDVTIGKDVTSIDRDAFKGCVNVEKVYCYADPTALTWNDYNCDDFRPDGSTECQVTDPSAWSAFVDIVNVTFVQYHISYDLYVAGKQVNELNASDILGDHAASYDASTKTLTLYDDIHPTILYGACIIVNEENVTIQVAAPCTITNSEGGICFTKDATITGPALLTIRSSSDGISMNKGSLTIKDANLLMKDLGGPGILGSGGDLTIQSSTVNISSSGYRAIYGWNDLTLIDCYIETPEEGEYNTSNKQLVDKNGDMAEEVSIKPSIYDIYVAGTRVSEENASNILGDGAVSYDASTKTLTLKGDISSDKLYDACIIVNEENVTIQVAKPCTINNSEGGICFTKDATITGPALLTIRSSSNGISMNKGSLTIKDANLLIENNYSPCIWGSGGNLTIQSSTVNFSTTSDNGSICGWKNLSLIYCYIETPEEGEYNTFKKRLVDQNGEVAQEVSIKPGTPPVYYKLYVAGTRVTSHNASDILGNGNVIYDEDNNKLIISGNITASGSEGYGTGIYSDIEDLTVQVSAPTSITATDVGMYFTKNATITGASLLTVKNPTNDFAIVGQYSDVTIKNANLSLTGQLTSWEEGILTIQSSTIDITSLIPAICGWSTMKMTGCYIETPENVVYNISKKQLEDKKGKAANTVRIVSTLEDNDLAFSEISATATIGQPFTEPTLTNPHSFAVTYSSSKPEVAKVDEKTGKVTLVSTGKSIITASYAGNATYKAGDVSYTLTVKAAKGDVNHDGKIDQTDVALTAQHILGKKPDGFFEASAHMNDDGVINAADLVLIVAEANKP